MSSFDAFVIRRFAALSGFAPSAESLPSAACLLHMRAHCCLRTLVSLPTARYAIRRAYWLSCSFNAIKASKVLEVELVPGA